MDTQNTSPTFVLPPPLSPSPSSRDTAPEELKEALELLGCVDLEEGELALLVGALDQSGDGEISVNEFEQVGRGGRVEANKG